MLYFAMFLLLALMIEIQISKSLVIFINGKFYSVLTISELNTVGEVGLILISYFMYFMV